MNIEDVLSGKEQAIVDDACRAIAQLAPYRRDGTQVTRQRIEALCRQVRAAVSTRDLTELRKYVRQIARERSEAGFAAPDVQAAFSALEDAVWRHAAAGLPAYDQTFGIGLVCTALAHGRHALWRAFESVAPRGPAPILDLTALFESPEYVPAPRPAAELVVPL